MSKIDIRTLSTHSRVHTGTIYSAQVDQILAAAVFQQLGFYETFGIPEHARVEFLWPSDYDERGTTNAPSVSFTVTEDLDKLNAILSTSPAT